MTELGNTRQIRETAQRLQHVFGRARTLSEVERRIAIEPDTARRQHLTHLKTYLEKQNAALDKTKGNKGAYERLTDKISKEIQGITFRFAKSNGRPPSGYPELLYYTGSQLDADGNLLKEKFNTAAQSEPGYADIHQQLSGIKKSAFILPRELADSYDIINHNFASIEAWLRTGESREFDTLKQRLARHAFLNQGEAVDYIITRSFGMLGKIHARKLRDYVRQLKEEIDQDREIPFFSLATSDSSIRERKKVEAIEKALFISFEQAIGLKGFEKIKETFDTDSYIKIREFLSYEIADIPILNLAAAKMTLLYPEYRDFVGFIKKYATYDADHKNLNLNQLIDISAFKLTSIDYPMLGKALLNGAKSNMLYFKCCQWLDQLPVNHQGKLLTKATDSQLFQAMNSVDPLFSNAELEQYKDLQIAREMLEARKIMKECEDQNSEASHDDKVTGLLPEIFLDGAQFDMPDCEFSRVSFDDRRYFHLGRLAKDICEHAGGHWSEPVRDSYINRTSAYYAIKTKSLSGREHDKEILSYVWIRFDMNDDIVLDGPEADTERSGITLSNWYKIRDLLQEEFANRNSMINDVTFGPSQTWPDLIADAKSTVEDEMQRGHVKAIREDQIATPEKIVEKLMAESDPSKVIPAIKRITTEDIMARLAATKNKPEDPTP